jgi:hypothetical protein
MVDALLKYSVLDFRALRPYAWAMLLPLVLLVPAAVVYPAVLISVLPLLTAIVASSFIFSLDESAGLELLRALLPGTKRQAVYGRYLMLFLIFGAAFTISVLVTIIPVMASTQGFHGYLAVLCSALSSGLIFLAVQAPLYVWFGYTRARYWGYAAFLVLTGMYGAVLFAVPKAAVLMVNSPLPLLLTVGALGLFVSSAMGAAKAAEKREM